MKIPVIWLSYRDDTPSRGYWDHGIVNEIFDNKLWSVSEGYSFVHLDSFDSHFQYNSGAVVVLPARSHVDFIDKLNEDIAKLDWVVLVLTGDEESVFPVEKVFHDKIKIYVMSPRKGRHDEYRFLGTGYPPQLHDLVTSEESDKDIDWFFSGQVTHDRRKQCVEQLRTMTNGVLNETKGFTQGFDHEKYYDYFKRAKVAPAPSGPETPDSFRLFEALETACVPIADTRVPKGDFQDDYWTFFFGEEPPFPIIKEYEQLKGYVQDQVNEYPRINNRVFAWWIAKKRQLAYQVHNDIKSVSGMSQTINNEVTIIIPTSPIKSHPDTTIIDETIRSVRHHFPTAEIIITFDGVRPENEDRRSNYEEFIRRLLWKCNYEYKNVLPLIFDEHLHQTGMARKTLEYIKTPLLLYVEQDTPLVIDEYIDWNHITEVMAKGLADVIRFHHEAVIPKEHSHMIHGHQKLCSCDFMRTSQWSQRPHLSTVAFYRRILNTEFSEGAKSFIEDKMHGVCHEAYLNDGMFGWDNYRILIYLPGENIKRSYHTDGRAGEAKYDDTQVF